MATPPTFTSGSILTAAQMNAVGIWLIKTQTIGTAVSSVTVTGAFSSDYDNYLIQVVGGTGSAEDNGRMTLGSTNTGYYGVLAYANYATPGTYTGAGDNNAAQFSFIWRNVTNGQYANIDVIGPNLPKPTMVRGLWVAQNGAAGQYTGYVSGTTQYTSFTLSPITGTMTGGTIRVYGYRN